MSGYGASFVGARPDRATSFRELTHLLRETNASWLAASPKNFTEEIIVRASEGSDWVSVQRALADQLLETISRVLGTTTIMIYVVDEVVLRFSYRRFNNGQAVRALEYVDYVNPKERGKWTKVEGEPEPWEAILFSHRLIELYRKYAPDEVHEGCAESKIKPGFSIPWACDASTVAEIARALQLPWEPTENRFPPATQTEVIPGSPERLKAFLRQQWRPWWKFWRRYRSRGVGTP
jgi:hypothetical protein